jgi:hypothetical protein
VCRRVAALLLGGLVIGGCVEAYPEVVVVNRTAPHLVVKDPSFSGCRWETVLGYGESTLPQACLPGEDRVHLQRLDLRRYCGDREAAGIADPACDGDTTVLASTSSGTVEASAEAPTWYPYQTVSVHRVDYGDRIVVELRLTDLEQDFSAPSPFGH